MEFLMQLYRAVPRSGFDPERQHKRHPGLRLPANVPYFVDNLWEFTRPDDKPSRRHAVYASPTPKLALAGAAGVGRPEEGFIVCRVDCLTPPKAFQLSVADARGHSDLISLRQAIQNRFAGRTPLAFETRLALAPMFLPGIARHELAVAMEQSATLRDLVTTLAATITLWNEKPDIACGELFFEIEEANAYTLHPV